MKVNKILLITLFIILSPALGLATAFNEMPKITTDLDNPILYAIVNSRGVMVGETQNSAFDCGVLTAWDIDKTVSVDRVVINGEIPERSFWFLTEGSTPGTVLIHNYDFPEQTLTHNPFHIISDPADGQNEWYILPNGVNDYGLTICSSATITNPNCLDSSNYPKGQIYEAEPGKWALTGGWSPSHNDWRGTTWSFIPVETGMSPEEYASRVMEAYLHRVEYTEKVFYPQPYLWDLSTLKYVVVDSEEYNDPSSKFALSRSMFSDNIVFLWTKEFGENPETATGNLQMDISSISEEMNKAFDYFYNNLGFIEPGFSCLDHYYLNFFIYPTTPNGSLYTYSLGEVPAMSIHPFWFKNSTYYGGANHELAHCFQGAAEKDCNTMIYTTIAESCAQFMINSYYEGNWPIYEPSHIRNFMANSHLAFLNDTHHYASPFVYEYWAEKHGRDIMGRLWRFGGSNDPIERYKAMMGMTQDEFIDEMYEAVSHFPTWDLSFGRDAYNNFRNQHGYIVRRVDDGTFAPASSRYPQGYGYNAIPLNIPSSSDRRVTVQLSHRPNDTFENSYPERMSWRYGLVAYLNNDSTLYSSAYSAGDTLVWNIPKNTVNLWLVVLGAPSEHYVNPDKYFCDDQFPWQARITGSAALGYDNTPLDTELADSVGGQSLLGDINFDNTVDINDVVCLVDLLLNSATHASHPEGDINIDKTIDISDVVSLVNIVLGMESRSIPEQNSATEAATYYIDSDGRLWINSSYDVAGIQSDIAGDYWEPSSILSRFNHANSTGNDVTRMIAYGNMSNFIPAGNHHVATLAPGSSVISLFLSDPEGRAIKVGKVSPSNILLPLDTQSPVEIGRYDMLGRSVDESYYGICIIKLSDGRYIKTRM